MHFLTKRSFFLWGSRMIRIRSEVRADGRGVWCFVYVNWFEGSIGIASFMKKRRFDRSNRSGMWSKASKIRVIVFKDKLSTAEVNVPSWSCANVIFYVHIHYYCLSIYMIRLYIIYICEDMKTNNNITIMYISFCIIVGSLAILRYILLLLLLYTYYDDYWKNVYDVFL